MFVRVCADSPLAHMLRMKKMSPTNSPYTPHGHQNNLQPFKQQNVSTDNRGALRVPRKQAHRHRCLNDHDSLQTRRCVREEKETPRLVTKQENFLREDDAVSFLDIRSFLNILIV